MNDMWVVKLDSGGQSYERAISAQQDANGGYVIAGGTWSFGAGSADFYVLKVDENGEIPNCSAISPSNSTVYTPSVQVNISDSVTTAADGLSNSTYAITTVPAASEMDGCFNTAAGTGRLINISTRAMVQTGDGAEIAGFWIEGTAPKTVLIRARGPSMGSTPINLAGVLPNPSLTLYSGQTMIARNDDWQTSDPTCELNGYVCGGSAEISATGLDPCQPISGQIVPRQGCTFESAILITRPPGGYTAIVSGVNGETGIALAGVFEADTVAESRLINISTRSRVETVDSVMIGGFWIGGAPAIRQS